MVLPSLSPYVLIGSVVAARTVGLATLVGLPVLLVVLARRRWFCRYVCPVGLMTEQASRLRRRGKPAARRLPPLGTWIVLLTLAGACFGYPVLLWMDPLAIFQGVFTLRESPLGVAGQASAGALAAILGISVLLPGAWCLRICPLGATQELLILPRRWMRSVRSEPPEQSTHAEPAEGSTPSASCARELLAEPRTKASRLFPRRSVLSAAFGAVCAGLGARWAIDASTRPSRDRHRALRPPGSMESPPFTGLCIRCGNCVRACPVQIIEPDGADGGLAGLLAPVIRFREDYCREDCHACTQVCPSGAISRMSLDEKRKARIGLAVLDASICLLADDRECDICARVCPFEAIDIVWNEEEYIALPQVDAAKCPGCGACEVACPGTNEWEREHAREPIPLRKAIEVRPLRSS
jgi:MauM/NapG family ferredoxin protein